MHDREEEVFDFVEEIVLGGWNIKVSVDQEMSLIMITLHSRHSSDCRINFFTTQLEAVNWIESVVGQYIG